MTCLLAELLKPHLIAVVDLARLVLQPMVLQGGGEEPKVFLC